MKIFPQVAVSVVLCAALFGCFTGDLLGPSPSPSPTQDAGSSGGGLPCAVQAVLAAKCQSCHGATPVAGAPMALVTYADLLAPSALDAAQSYLQRSLARMRDLARPMPPGGGVVAAEIQALADWQASGAREATCGSEVEAGPNPYATPEVCTSGMSTPPVITGGSMRPGHDCMSSKCHGDPALGVEMAFAGTVYPTAHEPDFCQGASGTASAMKVSLVDAKGTTYTAEVNTYGNFYLRLLDSNGVKLPITAPFTQVKVVGGPAHRDMSESAPSGNCNACHTNAGSNPFAPEFPSVAPGRIMAP